MSVSYEMDGRSREICGNALLTDHGRCAESVAARLLGVVFPEGNGCVLRKPEIKQAGADAFDRIAQAGGDFFCRAAAGMELRQLVDMLRRLEPVTGGGMTPFRRQEAEQFQPVVNCIRGAIKLGGDVLNGFALLPQIAEHLLFNG